jgi:hypothetical protein
MHENSGEKTPKCRIRLYLWRYSQVHFMDYEMSRHDRDLPVRGIGGRNSSEYPLCAKGYDVELLHGFEEFSSGVGLFVVFEEKLPVVRASEDE